MQLIFEQSDNVSNIQCWINSQSNEFVGIGHSDTCSIQLVFNFDVSINEILKQIKSKLLLSSIKSILWND